MTIRLLEHKPFHYLKTVKWLGDERIKRELGFTLNLSIFQHNRFYKYKKSPKIFCIYKNTQYVGNITIIEHYKNLVELQIFIGEVSCTRKKVGLIAIKKMLSSICKSKKVFVRCDAGLKNFYFKSKFKDDFTLDCRIHKRVPSHILMSSTGKKNG
jgi:hypothetical protein